jgi:phosphate transport system substrate-binding protein
VHARLVGIQGVPQFRGELRIEGQGTFAGVRQFCGNEAQIVTASDQLHRQEWTGAGCAASLDIREFKIAQDAVVIVANRRNPAFPNATASQSMSRTDICNLFRPGAPPTWKRYLPTPDSGTGRFISRKLCGNDDLLAGADAVQRTEDYGWLAQAIGRDPAGVGVLPYDIYAKFSGDLMILMPDGVEPSFENIRLGRYPLVRDLYVYSSMDLLRSRPDVFNWVNFAVSSVATMLEATKFFPVSSGVRRASEGILHSVPSSVSLRQTP